MNTLFEHPGHGSEILGVGLDLLIFAVVVALIAFAVRHHHRSK